MDATFISRPISSLQAKSTIEGSKRACSGTLKRPHPFNPAISRVQIETLATGDFVRRGQNLVFVGQSGVGKSYLIQSIGLAACSLGYKVRYLTSGQLLEDLTAALADQTIHQRVRFSPSSTC